MKPSSAVVQMKADAQYVVVTLYVTDGVLTVWKDRARVVINLQVTKKGNTKKMAKLQDVFKFVQIL